MKLLYEEKMRLRTSDYDQYDQIKIHSMLDIFQDLAGYHADIMKIGYHELTERNLCWVLLSSKIDIIKNVDYDSVVTLRTWPNEKGRADFIRDYEIETENKEIIVKASSRWVILNKDTRSITRGKDITYDGEIIDKKNYEELKKINVTIPHTKEFVKSHKVLNNDMDHNGHMNNSKYMEMIYNMTDPMILNKYKKIQIDYLHEALLNDTIDVYTFSIDNALYFVGYINLIESFIVKMEE